MREQPALLALHAPRYLEQLIPLKGRPFEMVALVARGSSDHAAMYARYLIEIHLGIPATLVAPSVLTRYGVAIKYPPCLAIGISQSGAAPDVAEVIQAFRDAGHPTLGITNTAGSLLAETAEHCLHLGVGEETSVAATKTYSASLLALYQLVAALGGNLPELALPTEVWFEDCNRAASDAAPLFLRNSRSFALARGYRFASAFETALKLMECALLPCKPFSTADFQHGPRALATAGSAAVVFGEWTPWLADGGCEVCLAPAPPTPEPLQPLWDALFGQWLALHTARARGLNPDEVVGLQKVTRTL